MSDAAGLPAAQLLDFSANINPLGPPEWLRSLISAHVGDLAHYPDPDCTELVEALARENNLAKEQILVGNGATELLHLLPRALEVSRALIPVPSYADYEDAALLAGLEVQHLALDETNQFVLDFSALAALLKPAQLVLLGQPNNPTGRTLDPDRLRQLAEEFPQTFFVVDESFIAFADDSRTLRSDRPVNVIIVESLTKAFAIPGLRLGYLIADAGIVAKVRRLLPNWTVNTLAQYIAERMG